MSEYPVTEIVELHTRTQTGAVSKSRLALRIVGERC